MPNEVEKLASSEIAQSRERFEKWGNAKGTMGDSWDGHHYENILHECAWQAWQAAERDTRERVAQQGRSLLELVLDVTLQDSSKKNEILDTFERRIRGKE